MTDETQTKTDQPAAKSKEAWFAAKVHEDVKLPSGNEVDIQIPNLPKMLKAGDVPNDLIDAAIQFEQTSESDDVVEAVKRQQDFIEWIVPLTVVNPAITAEDVAEDRLPAEDVAMLAQFAARVRDTDAVGNHIGGLHTNREWRRFRGRPDFDEAPEVLS